MGYAGWGKDWYIVKKQEGEHGTDKKKHSVEGGHVRAVLRRMCAGCCSVCVLCVCVCVCLPCLCACCLGCFCALFVLSAPRNAFFSNYMHYVDRERHTT